MGDNVINKLQVSHAVQAAMQEQSRQAQAEAYSPATQELLRKKTLTLGEPSDDEKDEVVEKGLGEDAGLVNENVEAKGGDLPAVFDPSEPTSPKTNSIDMEIASQREASPAQVAANEATGATQAELEKAADEAAKRAMDDAEAPADMLVDPPPGLPDMPTVYRSQQQNFKAKLDGDEKRGRKKAKVSCEKEPQVRDLTGEFEAAAEQGTPRKGKGKAKARSKAKASPSPKSSKPGQSPRFARGKAKAKAKAAAKASPKAAAKASAKAAAKASAKAAAKAAQPKPNPKRKSSKKAKAEDEGETEEAVVSGDGIMSNRASFAGRYPPKTAQARARFEALVKAFELKIQFLVDSPSLVEDGRVSVFNLLSFAFRRSGGPLPSRISQLSRGPPQSATRRWPMLPQTSSSSSIRA